MRGRPLALPRVPPEYRRQIAPWFRELLLARRGAEFQMATISSCLALCREGRAVTVAPRNLLEDDLRAGRLKPLPLDPGVTVSACAYRLRSHPLSQFQLRSALRPWSWLRPHDTTWALCHMTFVHPFCLTTHHEPQCWDKYDCQPSAQVLIH